MLQYCYLHRTSYNFVFWLKVSSQNVAIDSYCKLAINLGLIKESKESAKENDPEQIFGLVCSWLQMKTKWLLLLDNADDIMAEEIFNYLPRIGGDIILTTRDYISLSMATVIDVEKMKEGEAMSLLLGASIDLVDWQSAKFNHAQEIITELDCMQLAIDLE